MKLDMRKLVSSLSLPFLAGLIGNIFTIDAVANWYPTLVKPAFTPPSWVFAPAWTILYLLMGISFYLVWMSRKDKLVALQLYGMQLAFNALWSVLFFGLRLPTIAFIEIMFLWVSVASTAHAFSKISKTAGYLLIPYLVWVTFALFLNMGIVFLN